MAWWAAIPAVAGAVMGQSAAKKEARAAEAAMQQALRLFGGVKIPGLTEQEISPEMLQYIGDYLPMLEQIEQLGPSAMEQVSIDPRLRQQQMSALEQLAGLSQGGMSQADLAALELARRGAASEAQAKQGQILQEMQQRGQAGSGAELIARLKAAQSGADRQSSEGLQIARMAQERALQALSGMGSLAGNIRSQEYGEQSDLARARDVVNQFNTQNRQNVGQRNVQSQNQARLQNLSQQQRLAEQNVALRNQAEQYNKQLLQQQFQNQMARASGMAGQYRGIADAASAQAGRTADMYAGVGKGIGEIIGGIYSNQKKDEE